MPVEIVKSGSKYEVQNVKDVLDILQRLSASQRGERFSHLSRKCGGVSKNRLYRMLCTLEAEAFVTKDRKGGYSLGPAAYGMAKGILVDQDFAAALQPVMRKLAAVTQEAVYVARMVGNVALLIDYEESAQKVRAVRCLGKTFDVTDGVLIEEAESYRVYAAEDLLVAEVTTVSVVFKDCFQEQLALVVIAPTCRMSKSRISGELLPELTGQAEEAVSIIGFKCSRG